MGKCAKSLISPTFRPEDIESARARMYEGLPPLAESEDVVSVTEATPID